MSGEGHGNARAGGGTATLDPTTEAGQDSPFHNQEIDTEVKQHPEGQTEFMKRPENYTMNERINALVEVVRSGEWATSQKGRRKYDENFRRHAGKLFEEEMGLTIAEPDATGYQKVKYDWVKEAKTRAKGVAKKGAVSAGIVGAVTVLSGGTLTIPAVASLAGSVAGRGAVEAYRMISGKERKMRERILLARERMYQKAQELASRVPTVPPFINVEDAELTFEQRHELKAWQDKRNQNATDLINFVHATEHNCVRFEFDSRGDPFIQTDVGGAPLATGSARNEPRIGGNEGPAINRGTEVVQNSQYGAGKTLDEMEKELEHYRRKMDRIASIMAAVGGFGAGAGASAMQILQLKAEAAKQAQEMAQGTWADINGDGVQHLIHTLDAHSEASQVVFNYGQMDALGHVHSGASELTAAAHDAAAHGYPLNPMLVEHMGRQVVAHSLNAADSAKALGLLREYVGGNVTAEHLQQLYFFIPGLLATYGAIGLAEHVGQNASNKERDQRRLDYLLQEEKERRDLQPEAGMSVLEQLRKLAAKEKKIFPAQDQDWVQESEDDDGNPVHKWIHITELLPGDQEGRAKVLMSNADGQYEHEDIMDLDEIFRHYSHVPRKPESQERDNRSGTRTSNSTGSGGRGTGGDSGDGDGGGGAEGARDHNGGRPEGGNRDQNNRTDRRNNRNQNRTETGGTAEADDDEAEPTLSQAERAEKMRLAQELVASNPAPKAFDVHALTSEDGDKFVPTAFVWSEQYPVNVILLGLNQVKPANLDDAALENNPIARFFKLKVAFRKGEGPDVRLQLKVTKAVNARHAPSVLAEAVRVVTVDGNPLSTINISGLYSDGDDSADIAKSKPEPQPSGSIPEYEVTARGVEIPNVQVGTEFQIPVIQKPYKFGKARTEPFHMPDFLINGGLSAWVGEAASDYPEQQRIAAAIAGVKNGELDQLRYQCKITKIYRNPDGSTKTVHYELLHSGPIKKEPKENVEGDIEALVREKPAKDFDLEIRGDGTDANPYEYDKGIPWCDEINMPIRLRFFLSSTEEYERRKASGQQMRGFSETMTLIDEYVKRKSRGENVRLRLRAFGRDRDHLQVTVSDLLVDGSRVDLRGERGSRPERENRPASRNFTIADRDPAAVGETFDLDYGNERVPIRKVSASRKDGSKYEIFVPENVSINGKRGGSVHTSSELMQRYVDQDLRSKTKMRIKTIFMKPGAFGGKFDFLYEVIPVRDESNATIPAPEPVVPPEPDAGGEPVPIHTESLIDPEHLRVNEEAAEIAAYTAKGEEMLKDLPEKITGLTKFDVTNNAGRSRVIALGMLADKINPDLLTSENATVVKVSAMHAVIKQEQQAFKLTKGKFDKEKPVMDELLDKEAEQINEVSGPPPVIESFSPVAAPVEVEATSESPVLEPLPEGSRTLPPREIES